MQRAFVSLFFTVPLWFVLNHKWIHEKQKMDQSSEINRPEIRDIFKMYRTIDKPGKIDFCKLLFTVTQASVWKVFTVGESNILSSPVSKRKRAICASPFDASTLRTVNRHPNQLVRELEAKTSNPGQWILIYAFSTPSPDRIYTPSLTLAIMFTKQRFSSPCQYVNFNNKPVNKVKRRPLADSVRV